MSLTFRFQGVYLDRAAILFAELVRQEFNRGQHLGGVRFLDVPYHGEGFVMSGQGVRFEQASMLDQNAFSFGRYDCDKEPNIKRSLAILKEIADDYGLFLESSN